MNPKINIKNLIRQLVPPHRRQPVRLWILGVFLGPLEFLYNRFSVWRDEVRMRINLSSQTRVLEGYLRLKYDATLSIKIVSSEDGLLLVGLESEGDNYQPRFGLEEEVDYLVPVPFENELKGSLGDYDFIIYLPPGVDINLIRAEVEKYRQAGVTYTIIQNAA